MKKVHLIVTVLILTNITSTQSPSALDYYRYFYANYNHAHNDLEKSLNWYKKLLNNDSPPYMYKGYVEFLFDSGKMHDIVTLIPKLDTYFKDDPDIQLKFALALSQTGNVQEADNRLIRTTNKHKNHQELTFYTAQSYIRRKEPENAVAIIDSLLNSTPRNPTHYLFYFLKSQIYASLNKFDSAIESIKTSIKINPHFEKGKLIQAILYEKKGMKEKALSLYSSLIKKTRSPLLKRQLSQHIQTLNNPTFSKKRAIPDEINPQQKLNHALATVNAQLEKNPNDIPARVLKLQLIVAQKDYPSALTLLKQWITQEPKKALWYEYLYQLSQRIDPELVIPFLLVQHQHNTQNPLVLTYLGALYLKTSEPQKGLAYLDNAFAKTTDLQLKTKISFQQALVYFKQKKFKPMIKKLEQGEKLGQDYPPLLNMLAYAYAKQKTKLKRAHELVDKALKEDKNNHYYLDTKAIIFEVQKLYAQAEHILNRLTQKHKDPIIFKHLSTTLYKQHKNKQAIQALTQAIAYAKNPQEKQKYKIKLDQISSP